MFIAQVPVVSTLLLAVRDAARLFAATSLNAVSISPLRFMARKNPTDFSSARAVARMGKRRGVCRVFSGET